MAGLTIQTPCGPLTVPIPSIPFPPPLPSLSIFPIPFPPKLAFKLPDCDVVKAAIGAKTEPPGDSLP
jgi:hypothetical protein